MGRRANLRRVYLSAIEKQNSITVTPRLASARVVSSPLRAAAPSVLATKAPPTTAILQTPQTAAAAPSPSSAATPASIIAQACPSGIDKQPCGCSVDTASMQTLFQTSIQQRLLLWPPPDASFANCSGVTGASATQRAGQIATGAGGITTALTAGATPLIAASAAIPIIGIGVAAIGTIISMIGAHHAQAVAAQNSALCTAVPATNQALQQIDAELAAGTITAAQAQGFYSQIQAQFTAAMKAGTSYKQCDALYAYNLALQMVLAARTADLQTSANAAAGGLLAPGGVLAAGSSSSLLLWGAAAAVAYLIFSK
jgi:hypothetical protein